MMADLARRAPPRSARRSGRVRGSRHLMKKEKSRRRKPSGFFWSAHCPEWDSECDSDMKSNSRAVFLVAPILLMLHPTDVWAFGRKNNLIAPQGPPSVV